MGRAGIEVVGEEGGGVVEGTKDEIKVDPVANTGAVEWTAWWLPFAVTRQCATRRQRKKAQGTTGCGEGSETSTALDPIPQDHTYYTL